MLYFWKANGPRTSKMIFWTVKYTNTQIQVHKYTNTQIQHLRKGQKYPIYTYIFEKPMIQGHQKWYSGLSNTQIHKYKDTNTQIHCDEVPEIPNMCYIFEKPGVQGHQKWYSELSKIQIHRRCDNYVSPNLKLWTTALTHWLTFALYHQVYFHWLCIFFW